jgi:siderophore synthetase component
MQSSTLPPCGIEHLSAATWAHVNRAHVCKMIEEFSHERLVAPRLAQGSTDRYILTTDEPGVTYRFKARRRLLDHWSIDPASIEKHVRDQRCPLDSVQLVLELKSTLGIAPDMLPTYLEELTGTLYGDAYKATHGRHTAAELASADFQTVEAAMTAGHPCFVANGGRVGFGVDDHRAFSPESARAVRIVWLAAHRSRAHFAAVDGLDAADHYRAELGEEELSAFRSLLVAAGRAPDDYLFLPVHPWQWRDKIALAFAGELASGMLVYLGESRDAYQAQQSIRTLFNRSHPERAYVKMALSILNMGFMRGLSPGYMQSTPAINQWVHDTIAQDETLQASGFRILREFATVGYRHPAFEAGAPKGSPYQKMLSALWRESPTPLLAPDERVVTMASIVHRDAQGRSLVAALITQSGVSAEAWLRAYLEAYFVPLVHCFYAHDMVFMPHGENLILVLRDGLPVRAFLKDVGEEVAVFRGDGAREAAMPADVQRIVVEVPEHIRLLSIFTDVFDCFFRFLAPIFADDLGLEEGRFWELVAASALDYQARHPALAARFARYDLFAERFTLSCLNRLQLRNNRQLLDLSDPAAALQLVGELDNPLHPHRARATPRSRQGAPSHLDLSP